MAILCGKRETVVRFKIAGLLILLSNSLVFANTRPEVIVFVSFSMPSTAIKLWMKEAITYDASVNIRGLIGNQFPQTMATVQKLINENDNQGGINTKVPAVVVRQTPQNNAFDVVYGTSSIKEALEIIR